MALYWMDGFDHYGTLARALEGVGGGAAWSQIDTTNNGYTLSTSNPATGAYHLRLADGSLTGRQARRVLGTASQVVGFGYRFAVGDLPAREGISNEAALVLADFRDVSNGAHCMVVMGTDGSVFAKRGGNFLGSELGGTTLGRSDPCVAAGGYHHFECKVKIDNSVGYIEVRINEVTVLNLTGIDTQNTANASCAQVAVGRSGAALSSGVAGYSTFDLEDTFTWNDDLSDPENQVGDWIGDKGVYLLKPNADTATSDFDINGSGTAYGALDEIPPSGAEYLDDATGTARTIVEVEPLPGSVAEVIAMQGFQYTRKEDSGTVTMRTGIVSGSDEAYGPDDSPSTAYAYLRPAVKTIDPDTGVAWTNSADPKLLIERTA